LSAVNGRQLISGFALVLILWVAVATASAGAAPSMTAARGVPDAGEGDVLAEEMTGAKEVPGPGDPNGSGTAEINLKPRKRELCWRLLWQNVSGVTGGVTGAHIHKGGATESGPIKVTFFEAPPPGDQGSGATGCTDVSKGLQKRIKQTPENYYANFHTTEFSSGAIRDQLKPVD
jgi:hypothetical protein